MKKWILLLIVIMAGSVSAQNFQLHYDMGKDRKYFTSTLEMFKPDEYGATFFFVDFDYNQPGNKSASLGYFEIARYVNLKFTGVKGLSATLQYNDGTAPWGALGQVWLAGFSYPIKFGNLITINTDILYRKDFLSNGSDMQVTFVWYKGFFNNKISFTGFMDIWTAKTAFWTKRKTVVLTEPQVWFKVHKHLDVGSEMEISKNFLPSDKWEFNPTIAFKWTF